MVQRRRFLGGERGGHQAGRGAARVLAGATCEATIQFVAFAAEEQGLYGSYEFVDRAAARGDSIAGAVILDMVAYWEDSYGILVEGEWAWDGLMDVMVASCDRWTQLAAQKTYGSWGSDHVPFQQAGIAAFLAIEQEWDEYGCYHRTCDVLAQQDMDMLADVTRAAVGTVGSLARVTGASGVASRCRSCPTRPSRRRSSPSTFRPPATSRWTSTM